MEWAAPDSSEFAGKERVAGLPLIAIGGLHQATRPRGNRSGLPRLFGHGAEGAAGLEVTAPSSGQARLTSRAPLPLDCAIHQGSPDNGLRYRWLSSSAVTLRT